MIGHICLRPCWTDAPSKVSYTGELCLVISFHFLIDYRGAVLFVAQLLGGITAAAIIDGLTPGPLSVANSLGRKLLRIRVQLASY